VDAAALILTHRSAAELVPAYVQSVELWLVPQQVAFVCSPAPAHADRRRPEEPHLREQRGRAGSLLYGLMFHRADE